MKIFTYLLFVLLLTSCSETRKVASPLLTEEAIVVAKHHFDAHTKKGTDLVPIIDWNGKVSFAIVPVQTLIPEKYEIVFSCEHGQFSIGSSNSARLWDKLQVNQKVIVKYRKIYEVTYKKDKEVERVLVDMDFIDAEPDDRVEK